MILSPRRFSRILAETEAPARVGLPTLNPSPSPAASTSLISTVAPASVSGYRSTTRMSPSDTVNCLPWVLMVAFMNKRKTKSSRPRGAQAEKGRAPAGRPISPRAWRDGHTAALARRLLGCSLVRLHPDGRREARAITEVEAYHGEDD